MQDPFRRESRSYPRLGIAYRVWGIPLPNGPTENRNFRGPAFGFSAPVFFNSPLAAPLSGERLAADIAAGAILTTKVSSPPAFVGCNALNTGKSLEAVVPWI